MVAEPAPLVKIARYWMPFWASVVTAVVYEVEMAPARLVQVLPALELTCHCKLGEGVPEAAAVKVAVLPAFTATLAGCVVMVGAPLTVKMAAVVVAVPAVLVNTARYWVPELAAEVEAVV